MMIVKTPVTIAGGAGVALARISRTLASATPATDLPLLQDNGGTRKVIALVLAQVPLPETADVPVTGAEE
jgi:hypothetical protein